ncbi:MAG: SpoIIE family protein phosphatase [Firmicutes bacterium]|nr:SpoIIE family protein phosphatase [Bacillota bacterium]
MTKHRGKYIAIFISRYIAFFAVVFVLWFARIDATISPFAAAFLFASVFLPINMWVAGTSAFLLSMFVDSSHAGIVANIFAVGVFFLFAFLYKRYEVKITKRRLENWLVIAAFAISQILGIVYAYMDETEYLTELFKSLVSLLVGGVFLFCLTILIKTARVRRGKIPWTIDQKICLSVFVVVFALGLGGLEHDNFSTHRFVTILVILCGVYWLSPKTTLVVAIMMGLGRSFIALNLNFVAVYAILAMVVIGFKSKKPYYSVIALVVTDIVLGTYFGAYVQYTFFDLLPVFLAIAVFLLLPKRVVEWIDFSVHKLGLNLVSKNTINQSKAAMNARLNNLGAVFAEMSSIYKNMLSVNLTPEQGAEMVTLGVLTGVCENCPNRGNCHRAPSDTDQIRGAVKTLVEGGLVRGSVNPLDAPSVLTMRCGRLNNLLGHANELITGLERRRHRTALLDSGKLLMAQLLGGVGNLCSTIADDLSQNLVFENDRADEIRGDLLYHNIVTSDCLITRSGSEYTVSLLVPRIDANNRAIPKIVGRAVGHKMMLDSIDDTTTAGFTIVTLRTAPRYALTLGIAQAAKGFGPTCGDSYTVLRINTEKTMLAVCDGMGAGEPAQRASTLALSLIENFYRAHFPNETIMTTVNQLLTITETEVFSALDIAVFNMATGGVDFIKVGGVEGFIKRAREVEVVDSGSLPLGILDEIRPKITRAVLSAGDSIILLSDGIIDAFASDRAGLANFINNTDGTDPQKLANEIMAEAINRGGSPPADDATIIVSRVNSSGGGY